MYGHGDFHESYYEHGCSITHQKDVLETDIIGSTYSAYFKRWWYDLFLLYCSDKRSKIYYNSTHSMKVERARHFRRYRNCIHPLSKFRMFWDTFMTFVILSHKIIIHHSTSLVAARIPLSLYFFGVFLEFVLILDVYINTKCGFIDTTARKIVLDLHKALKHYCSTKLFIHVASAIPLHSIMFLRYGMNIECDKCKCNIFNCVVTLISMVTLLRIYEVTNAWTRERDSFRLTCFCRFLRIGVLGVLTMQAYLTLADTITLLFFLKSGVIQHSYLSFVIYIKLNNLIPMYVSLLSYDFYRVFRALLLFSFDYYLDKVSAIIAYVIAHIFYMWGIIEVLTCVARGRYPEDQIIHAKGAIMGLSRCRQLPDHLGSKLQQYYDFNMTMLNIVEKQNGLQKSLPAVLKKEIVLNCFGRMVMRIPYFSEWPMKLIESLTLLLKEETFLQNDVVADSGMPGDGLMIVDVGVMAVYSSNHHEMGHLIDGDYFGELSLVTDKEMRTSYIIAVTSCKVLILEKAEFRKCMRDHPDLFFEMKQQLVRKYSRVA